MRVVSTLFVVLFAAAAISFAGFVITDNVLSRWRQEGSLEDEEPPPLVSPNPEGQGPGDGPPPDGPPQGGPGVGEGGGPNGGRGPFDPVAFFNQRDTNGDGKLSDDEISERMRESLAEIDTDNDGAGSLEEWQERIRKRRAADGDPRGRGDRPRRPQRPPMT